MTMIYKNGWCIARTYLHIGQMVRIVDAGEQFLGNHLNNYFNYTSQTDLNDVLVIPSRGPFAYLPKRGSSEYDVLNIWRIVNMHGDAFHGAILHLKNPNGHNVIITSKGVKPFFKVKPSETKKIHLP